jgi:hypothetical protein
LPAFACDPGNLGVKTIASIDITIAPQQRKGCIDGLSQDRLIQYLVEQRLDDDVVGLRHRDVRAVVARAALVEA